MSKFKDDPKTIADMEYIDMLSKFNKPAGKIEKKPQSMFKSLKEFMGNENIPTEQQTEQTDSNKLK